MTDYSSAVKLIVVLALVIMLANLMGIGPTSPFASLQDSLQTGPVLPTFQDPFALREYVAHIAIPRVSSESQTTVGIPVPSILFGCTQEVYWECIDTPDGNDSYINLRPPNPVTGVPWIDAVRITEHPDQPADFRVSRVSVEIQARSADINATVTIALWNAPAGSSVFNIPLPRNDFVGGPFHNATFNIIPTGDVNWSVYPQDIITFESSNGTIDLSFVRISFYAGAVPNCLAPAGAWFPALDITGCQIAQFVDWIITGIQFIVNAIIFGFLYLMAWATWFATVIGGFIVGLVGMALWFTALDAPPEIKTFFAIFTVVVVGFLSLIIASLIRGGG